MSDSTSGRRRGLKPGQRHSGSFQKGFDPKRRGPEYLYDGMSFSQIARLEAPKCIELWIKCVNDDAVPWAMRLRASELITDRAYGKAVSTIDLSVTENRPVRALTMQELEAIASEGCVIEGEVAVSEAVAEANA